MAELGQCYGGQLLHFGLCSGWLVEGTPGQAVMLYYCHLTPPTDTTQLLQTDTILWQNYDSISITRR